MSLSKILMVSFRDQCLVTFCNLKIVEFLLCSASISVQVIDIVSIIDPLILINGKSL